MIKSGLASGILKRVLVESNRMGKLLLLLLEDELMPNLIPDRLAADVDVLMFSGKISVGCVGSEYFLENKLSGSDAELVRDVATEEAGLSVWQQAHFSLSASLDTRQLGQFHLATAFALRVVASLCK